MRNAEFHRLDRAVIVALPPLNRSANMSRLPNTLTPMLRKLMRWAPLDEADQRAVLALPHTVQRVAKASYIVREGTKASQCGVLLSGFAYRQKLVSSGSRQILAVHMPSDILDLQNALLEYADHSVQSLTDVELAMIPVEALKQLAFERSAVGMALWRDTLVDASIQRQWTANVGRRNARERTSHLLCEWGYRLEMAGLQSARGISCQ